MNILLVVSSCRAEVGNPDYALQFGLILEMYCRGAVQHIDSLMRQVEAINKMKTVTEILKSFKDTDVSTLNVTIHCIPPKWSPVIRVGTLAYSSFISNSAF